MFTDLSIEYASCIYVHRMLSKYFVLWKKINIIVIIATRALFRLYLFLLVLHLLHSNLPWTNLFSKHIIKLCWSLRIRYKNTDIIRKYASQAVMHFLSAGKYFNFSRLSDIRNFYDINIIGNIWVKWSKWWF